MDAFMKPIIASCLALAVLVVSACEASAGTFKPQPGTFGAYRAPAPARFDAPPAATAKPYSPPRAAPAPTPFRPYRGTSTYSNRGGVNAYPSAPKPRGYISPYGKP